MFVDRPPVGAVVDAVLTDNYDASIRATRHMIDHGHRRIGHFGDELAISTARERRRCFTDAMAAAGLFHGIEQLTADLRSEEEAISAVRRLMELPDPPTALFTSQKVITL